MEEYWDQIGIDGMKDESGQMEKWSWKLLTKQLTIKKSWLRDILINLRLPSQVSLLLAQLIFRCSLPLKKKCVKRLTRNNYHHNISYVLHFHILYMIKLPSLSVVTSTEVWDAFSTFLMHIHVTCWKEIYKFIVHVHLRI